MGAAFHRCSWRGLLGGGVACGPTPSRTSRPGRGSGRRVPVARQFRVPRPARARLPARRCPCRPEPDTRSRRSRPRQAPSPHPRPAPCGRRAAAGRAPAASPAEPARPPWPSGCAMCWGPAQRGCSATAGLGCEVSAAGGSLPLLQSRLPPPSGLVGGQRSLPSRLRGVGVRPLRPRPAPPQPGGSQEITPQARG